MTRKTMILPLVVALAAIACAGPYQAALAQEAPAVDQQAAIAAWEKASTPGEHHAFFAKHAGKWEVSGNMWMAPGGEPMPSESTGEARMILGGRYLLEEMKGTSMGMPFEGMGVTGYDNTTGIVTSVWYDNMGTVTTILTGTYPALGAPMELRGTMTDPYTKDALPMRTVTTFVSEDEKLFEYFSSLAAGMPEMKIMELRYKRVK